jgi:hypothetical protein
MIYQNQHLQTLKRLELFPKHLQNNIKIVRILEWNVEEHENIGRSCKKRQNIKKLEKKITQKRKNSPQVCGLV